MQSPYDWAWQSDSDANANWVAVASPMRDAMSASANRAHSADTTGDNNWGLVPDRLPQMEYAPTSAGEVMRISTAAGKQTDSSNFPEKPLTLPPGTSLHILLDRKTLTTAYPHPYCFRRKRSEDLADILRGPLRQTDA